MTTSTLTLNNIHIVEEYNNESGSIFAKFITDPVRSFERKRNDQQGQSTSSTTLIDNKHIQNMPIQQNINDSLSTILMKIDAISAIGDNWHEDGILGPNLHTISLSKDLASQFVENELIPFTVTQTVEEGICFVFKNSQKYLYLEIYNDGEMGIIVEDFATKRVLCNKPIIDKYDIINEISQFLYK